MVDLKIRVHDAVATNRRISVSVLFITCDAACSSGERATPLPAPAFRVFSKPRPKCAFFCDAVGIGSCASTDSAAVRAHGARHCKCQGHDKTRVQHALIACGMNAAHIADWHECGGRPADQRPRSRLKILFATTAS